MKSSINTRNLRILPSRSHLECVVLQIVDGLRSPPVVAVNAISTGLQVESKHAFQRWRVNCLCVFLNIAGKFKLHCL